MQERNNVRMHRSELTCAWWLWTAVLELAETHEWLAGHVAAAATLPTSASFTTRASLSFVCAACWRDQQSNAWAPRAW